MALFTEQQQKEYLERVRKFTDELIAKGPDACREFLVKLGMCNEDGSLSVNYGGYPTKCSECHSFGICTESMDWNCTKPWKDKKESEAKKEEPFCYNTKCKWYNGKCDNPVAIQLNNCTGRLKKDPKTSPCIECYTGHCSGSMMDQVACEAYREWRWK